MNLKSPPILDPDISEMGNVSSTTSRGVVMPVTANPAVNTDTNDVLLDPNDRINLPELLVKGILFEYMICIY